ncbi:unnamed protein product [Phaedon cochleariae]|uniref:Glucose-methanol-choline oxidoreductase N-terminal domain-containing protein n=1 Tax=Phaedon cochleariae TaxID=80249 RepID=A0A9P0DIE2_PHACE|nr:unnamed protein product [Phaedon cochleariae]
MIQSPARITSAKEVPRNFPRIFEKNNMSCGNCHATYLGPPLPAACPGASYLMFMSLVDVVIRNMCDVAETCERVTPKTKPEDEYDFIVIGTGPGGSATAGRLADLKKWKILVLEAGPDVPPPMNIPVLTSPYDTGTGVEWGISSPFNKTSPLDWGYKTEPESVAYQGYPEKRCTWTRGKGLGGCTSATEGYVRGIPRDFDDWAAMGNEGWSYKEMLPFFKRSERNADKHLVDEKYHGFEGPLTIGRYNYAPPMNDDLLLAAKQEGFPMTDDLNNGEDGIVGFTTMQSNVKNGHRQTVANAFLSPLRNNPYLHIMINSTASKIIFDSNKTATAVRFVYKNKTFTVKAKKEIILAGGTINTPHILLVSGVGPMETLRNVGIDVVHDLPGVGINLTDHVSLGLVYNLNKMKDFNEMSFQNVKWYKDKRGGPLSAPGLRQLLARLNSKYAEPSGKNPDLLLMFLGFIPKCSRTGSSNELEDPSHPNEPATIRIAPAILHPESRGYISIKSADLFEKPIMVANYLTSPNDQKVLLDGIRILQKYANNSYLKEKYGMELNKTNYGDCGIIHEYDSDEFWICAMKYKTLACKHLTSSCRMGPSSDKYAVVDSKLRVYGVKRLRIVDASVMPRTISAYTFSTTLAIGEKGADLIKKEWMNET